MGNRYRNVFILSVGALGSVGIGLVGFALTTNEPDRTDVIAIVVAVLSGALAAISMFTATRAMHRSLKGRSMTMRHRVPISHGLLPSSPEFEISLLIGNLEAIREGYGRVLRKDTDFLSHARLVKALADRGIWESEEVEDFIHAIRLRNQVVHGDLEEISSREVTTAVSDTERLLERLDTELDLGWPAHRIKIPSNDSRDVA